MSSYDVLMKFTHERLGVAKNDKNIKYYNLANGAIAGTLGITVVYPIDMLRKLMMLNGSSDFHRYNGFLHLV